MSKQDLPLVSIIMPYYKKERFFKLAYDSILNQTYRKFEIIIICDEVSKNSQKFLKKFKNNSKTKIFFNKQNFGVSYSRNFGIKKSKGKYVALLDSDDLWHKRKLEYQLRWMKKKKLKYSHTSFNIINEQGKLIGNQKAKNRLSYNDLLRCCYIGTSTVICESKLLKKNLFKNITTQEDYIVWLNISKKIDLYGLNQSLSSWRKSEKSLSSNIITKIKNAFLVYYKFQKFSFTKSVYRLLILIIFNFQKKINNRFNAK